MMHEVVQTWRQPPAATPLADAEFHVWRVPLTAAPETVIRARDVLNDEERRRADRLIADAPRRRFTLARAGLRRILARYLVVEPHALRFDAGPHGKPYIAGADVRFNLSHSGDWALVALARNREVGIDIERIDASRATLAIAARFFSPHEQAALARATDPVAAFFRCWSRKEAVIKALGEGLACPLDSFDVDLDEQQPRLLALRRPGADLAMWRLLAILAAPGYAAAAAIIGPHQSVAVAFDAEDF